MVKPCKLAMILVLGSAALLAFAGPTAAQFDVDRISKETGRSREQVRESIRDYEKDLDRETADRHDRYHAERPDRSCSDRRPDVRDHFNERAEHSRERQPKPDLSPQLTPFATRNWAPTKPMQSTTPLSQTKQWVQDHKQTFGPGATGLAKSWGGLSVGGWAGRSNGGWEVGGGVSVREAGPKPAKEVSVSEGKSVTENCVASGDAPPLTDLPPGSQQ